MSEETFKVEEICAIIKECGNSNVHIFEYKGLILEMRAKYPEPVVPTIEPVIVPDEVQAQADTQTRAANAREELKNKQQELDQMLIDDPEGYFEAIKHGDLIDEERS